MQKVAPLLAALVAGCSICKVAEMGFDDFMDEMVEECRKMCDGLDQNCRIRPANPRGSRASPKRVFCECVEPPPSEKRSFGSIALPLLPFDLVGSTANKHCSDCCAKFRLAGASIMDGLGHRCKCRN